MRRATLLVVFLAAATRALPAQRASASVGVGVTSVGYAGAGGLSAVTLSPEFHASGERGALAASGSWSRFSAGDWTAQGLVSGSLHTRVSVTGLLGEFGGVAGGSSHADGTGTGQGLAVARLLLLGASATTWIGGTAGSMWDGFVWRDVRQGELGWMWHGPSVTWSAVLTPTDAAGIRYADGGASVLLRRGPVEYAGSVGGRAGRSLPTRTLDSRIWGGVGITAWVAPRVALLASGGQYPADLMQGYPSGRYTSIAVRYGGQRRAAAGARVDDRDRSEWRAATRAGLEEFTHQRLPGGAQRLRVRARRAGAVEISGDPTGWVPAAMRAERGGWWMVDLRLAPGVHELVVRLDGGAWQVPPGLPVTRDEFGGRAGRLLVQ